MRDRRQLFPGGVEQDHLALQVLKINGVAGGFLFGEDASVVHITGTENFGSGLLVSGLSRELVPGDLAVGGAQGGAQPPEFLAHVGAGGLGGGGAPTGAQGDHEDGD